MLLVLGLYATAGFVLVPWLLPRLASDAVRDVYDAELRLGRVAFNPFRFRLQIDELALDDPNGEPLADVSQIVVNFQTSSLFRLAWTFHEIRVDSPRLTLRHAADGTLNAAFLGGEGNPPGKTEPAAEASSGLPKLLVFDFSINDSVVDWEDSVPPEPVRTRLGPVDIRIAELNTLPDRTGEQTVVIATETQGTLSWSGSLKLNPLRSAGRASIDGSLFPLISAYLRHQIGFEIVQGDADLEFAYDLGFRDDGALEVRIDDLGVRFSGIRVQPYLPDTPNSASDVLVVPDLSLEGGELRYPEQRVSLRSVEILGVELNMARDPDGNLNIVSSDADPAEATTAADEDENAATDSDDSTWQISLDEFLLDRASASFTDASLSPAAELGILNTRLAVSDISNAADAVFPAEFSTTLAGGGQIGARGEVTVLPSPRMSFDVDVERIALAVFQPYLQAIADVSLDSGELGLSGALHHAPDNLLTFSGDAEVVDLLLTETDEGSRLGSWERFGIDGIALDLEHASVAVNSLEFVEPYVDILIAEDGTVNLGRASKDADDSAATEPVQAESAQGQSSAFDVTIGGIDVSNASARFTDLALPLPFSTEIAELNGSLSTIATSSSEPAAVDLEGKVDAFGRVQVSGSITPLAPATDTDLRISFENVELPKASAYSIPFAGRAIADGRLDLDLGYRIEDGRMVGENNIVLRDLELGERVPHPGAASLPLGLAVALLKDTNGNIDVDLPVTGDINDPEFSYGGVIRRAITNLIVRIAASPFALLGNLLGVEADELEYLSFDPGESELPPPEREKILQLTEALNLRPELALEIPPVADAVVDLAALKAAQLDRIIDARLAETEAQTGAVAERRMTVLESLYAESFAAEGSEEELALMRSEFTSGFADGGAEAVLDVLAYTNAIERRLAERQTLPQNALQELAEQRAANVRSAISDIDTALDSRIVVADPVNASDGPDDAVRMRVALAADADKP